VDGADRPPHARISERSYDLPHRFPLMVQTVGLRDDAFPHVFVDGPAGIQLPVKAGDEVICRQAACDT
jgi:hypothetical protein